MTQKEKGSITENLKEYGYIKTHIFAEEVEQLKKVVGDFDKISDLRIAILKKCGITPHVREVMTDEEKTSNKIKRIALKNGISSEQAQKALEILGLI